MNDKNIIYFDLQLVSSGSVQCNVEPEDAGTLQHNFFSATARADLVIILHPPNTPVIVSRVNIITCLSANQVTRFPVENIQHSSIASDKIY